MFSTELNRFPADSRVWVYVSGRQLTEEESISALERARIFVGDWTSHDRRLKAHAEILSGRFLILLVDESQAGASGCGIDKSVHFVRQLGESLNTDFFDRMVFVWKEKELVRAARREDFEERFRTGDIGPETLVFDPLVQNKGQLVECFLRPLKDSWHARFV